MCTPAYDIAWFSVCMCMCAYVCECVFECVCVCVCVFECVCVCVCVCVFECLQFSCLICNSLQHGMYYISSILAITIDPYSYYVNAKFIFK